MRETTASHGGLLDHRILPRVLYYRGSLQSLRAQSPHGVAACRHSTYGLILTRQGYLYKFFQLPPLSLPAPLTAQIARGYHVK